MPKKLLSNGQNVFIGVQHTTTKLHEDGADLRCTKTWVEDENKVILASGVAVCSPKDIFSKKQGRKYAMRKLNASLKQYGYSREIRREICQVVFS